MLTLTDLKTLLEAKLPPPVENAARTELEILLILSDADVVDEEFGHVLVLEESDPPEVAEQLLRRLGEGAVHRGECFVRYLAGRGGNEYLPSAVLPKNLLTEEQTQQLLEELTEGGDDL